MKKFIRDNTVHLAISSCKTKRELSLLPHRAVSRMKRLNLHLVVLSSATVFQKIFDSYPGVRGRLQEFQVSTHLWFLDNTLVIQVTPYL